MKSKLDELGLAEKYDLDSYKKRNRLSYAATEAYNPFPPILHRFDSAYVVYSKDFQLKQITVLSGESDATPSLLVNKARGEQTGFGDHFVTYIFYLNQLSGFPDYDRIDWYSWRGGSYDGFEELWLFPMLIGEIILLVLWAVSVKRKQLLNK